jgi:hypothetical protein
VNPNNAASNTESAPFGTNGPIFIDGPTIPQQPAVAQIPVPVTSPGLYIDGGATYKSVIGSASDPPGSCSAPGAPFDATVKVTNTDNGQSITCVNRATDKLGAGLAVEIQTDQFIEIAALVDAPVPVRVSWGPAG